MPAFVLGGEHTQLALFERPCTFIFVTTCNCAASRGSSARLPELLRPSPRSALARAPSGLRQHPEICRTVLLSRDGLCRQHTCQARRRCR
jgi:hypothetical protein